MERFRRASELIAQVTRPTHAKGVRDYLLKLGRRRMTAKLWYPMKIARLIYTAQNTESPVQKAHSSGRRPMKRNACTSASAPTAPTNLAIKMARTAFALLVALIFRPTISGTAPTTKYKIIAPKC